jgi:peptide/nickel transport system ATP-binding protein
MPSPTQDLVGCPFASRCPRRIDGVCETTAPPLRRLGDHTIACHLELAGPAAAEATSPALGAGRP